jgi:tetratricopeptide (TPR) repeat protein
LISAVLVLNSCNNETEIKKTNLNTKKVDFLESDALSFPDSASLYLRWAEELLAQGDTNKGIDVLLQFQDHFPGNTSILNGIGYASLLARDTNTAIFHLENSLSINENQPEIEMELAFILQSQNNNRWKGISFQMISDVQNQIRSSRGYFVRGVYESNHNLLDQAIASFDSSILQQFTFVDAHIEKSLLLIEKNKVKQAMEGLYKALELDRKNPDIYFLAGECKRKLNEFEDAKNFYLQALELDPNHAGARKNLKTIN